MIRLANCGSKPKRRRQLPKKRNQAACRFWPLRGERLEDRALLDATPQLIDINKSPRGMSDGVPVTVGSYAYFSGSDGVSGSELWRSDGTLAGTSLVKDIVPGAGGSSVVPLINVSGNLFFK